MAKRYTDTEIWEEDWFIDLPLDHKLLFLYIKDKCDHSGFWRPNRRKFQMIIHGKMIMLDEFLHAVNKPDESTGQVKTRIRVLPNGRWFLTRFIPFQCGPAFKIKIGAHRGALELLIKNGIHPSEIPDFEWSGIQNYDFEQLKEIVYTKSLYRLSLLEANSMHSEIEKERGKMKDESKLGGKGGVGEKPNFAFQELYESSYSNLNVLSNGPVETRGITEVDFDHWKKFVDFVVEKNFQDLFKAIFVTPADFKRLVSKGFTEDIWEPVIAKMLSTGIQAQQNLYFRIPDFINYWKRDTGQNGSDKAVSFDTNQSGGFGNMEKW